MALGPGPVGKERPFPECGFVHIGQVAARSHLHSRPLVHRHGLMEQGGIDNQIDLAMAGVDVNKRGHVVAPLDMPARDLRRDHFQALQGRPRKCPDLAALDAEGLHFAAHQLSAGRATVADVAEGEVGLRCHAGVQFPGLLQRQSMDAAGGALFRRMVGVDGRGGPHRQAKAQEHRQEDSAIHGGSFYREMTSDFRNRPAEILPGFAGSGQ